ncbi:response regulator [Pseudobdellovibrio sp. HCB154]|uniref:response regulator n=1 Tax=Pseudobdellovibrio sp. HCB154 TaxID=3386277 RepID=UPI0039172214
MKKTIMVVEDESDIRSSLKEILELEGYDVLTAENGLEALNVLKASAKPNLILLDMKMPVMNGWEFADQFRKTYNNSTPIVVVTAAADSEQRAKDIHATGWVSKPFELGVLLKKIKECEN